MGWGFGDLIGGGVGDWIDDTLGIDDLVGGGGGSASADDLLGYDSGTDNFIQDLAWSQAMQPGDLPSKFPYTGGPFTQAVTGWPVQMSAEARGTPGSPPEGTFFLGYATPDLWFDRMDVTQAGAALVDDPAQRAGFSVRLVQRTPDGLTSFVSGFETGVTADGIIVREDLSLPVRSPLRYRVSYGGPIEPYWPMFVVVQKDGDFGSVPGIDYLRLQINVTFLAQELL